MLNPQRPSLRGQGWRGSRPDITWELELEPQLHSAPGIFFKLVFLNFLFIEFFFLPLSLLYSPPKYFSLPSGWPARLECSRAAPTGAGSCLADGMDEAGSGQAGPAGAVGRGSGSGSPPVIGGQDLIAQGCWKGIHGHAGTQEGLSGHGVWEDRGQRGQAEPTVLLS